MKNKHIGLFMLVTGLASSFLPAVASGYSLIVAPARFSVLQVMFDVIDKRSAVLVSYQGEAGTENPALHVWNGAAWNPLGLHELQELSFLQRTPDRAILIGDDALLPRAIRDRLAWMPEVIYIRELENAVLINDLGRVMNWSNHEWRWFAGRYKLDLEDRASQQRKASWYDQPGPIRKIEAPRQPPVSPSWQPAPEAFETRVVEQPAYVESAVIAIPEPPALEPAPAPVVEQAIETSAYASPEAPVSEAPPSQQDRLESLIKELQAPVPAPAIEEPAPVK